MDEERLSRDEERHLLDLFEKAALNDYPNPERNGCPGADFLRQVAVNRKSVSVRDPRLNHITRCSPCFREFTEFRTAARRRSRLLPIAGGALLVFAGAAGYLLERDRLFVPSQSSNGAYVAASLDLKDRSVVRGAGEPPSAAPKPDSLKLPREKLNLTITLPVASEAGEYEVQLLREVGHPVQSASGTAVIQPDGATILRLKLDISTVPKGKYLLGIRRVPWDWTFHPVEIG